MRVHGRRVGVHEDLESVLALHPDVARQVVLVALVERRANRRVVLAGQLQPQPVILHAFAPQIPDLVFVLRPGSFLARQGVAFLDGEVGLLLEEFACIGDALGQALALQVEEGKRYAQVLLENRIVQLRAGTGETVDVGLQEEVLLPIQRFDVVDENPLRHGVVKWRGAVVVAREDLRRPQRGLCLLRQGRERRHVGTLGCACERLGCDQPGNQ